MQFMELGEQLKAFRLESGLPAAEIAARLGVSRAALYRYEKGTVVKLETVRRLAALLQTSPLALLGIGIEYFSSPLRYFEKLRQVEKETTEIVQVFGPICYLATSDEYDSVLADAFRHVAASFGDDQQARLVAEGVLEILTERKQAFATERPALRIMLSARALRSFAESGVCGSLALSAELRRRCQAVALAEIERLAMLLEMPPPGLQLGVLRTLEPAGAFKLLRRGERRTLVVNPFKADMDITLQCGVSMFTGAADAVAIYHRMAESIWDKTLKGPAAAALLREMLASLPD